MFPTPLRPMLATLAGEPFRRPGWSFELKWDGFRTLAYLDDGLRLFSRNGHDVTRLYPELAEIVASVKARGLTVLDGEIIALDERGRPSFQKLQSRLGLRDDTTIRRLAAADPVSYVAFDLVAVDGQSLLNRPLSERRERLSTIVTQGSRLVLSRDFGPDGFALFEQARAMGLEGVIGKRLDSPYSPGKRSPDWQKVKVRLRQDAVVIGWTEGSQVLGFGSLLLGVMDQGRLRYAGGVGSGFDARTIEKLMPELKARETSLTTIAGDRWSPQRRTAHLMRPDLVVEVEFSEWTDEGLLRAPVFLGLRPDKSPEECIPERRFP